MAKNVAKHEASHVSKDIAMIHLPHFIFSCYASSPKESAQGDQLGIFTYPIAQLGIFLNRLARVWYVVLLGYFGIF